MNKDVLMDLVDLYIQMAIQCQAGVEMEPNLATVYPLLTMVKFLPMHGEKDKIIIKQKKNYLINYKLLINLIQKFIYIIINVDYYSNVYEFVKISYEYIDLYRRIYMINKNFIF